MSASAFVLQMVRSHYNRDESGFTSAAMALARSTKVSTVGATILDVVRDGVANQRRNRGNGAPAYLPPPPAALKTDGMLEELAPVTFDSLLLPSNLQLTLDELVVELEYRDELATRKLRARNRLLFHGPPGNGKTSGAAAMAHALGLKAYAISLPRTISKWVSATGENLGKIFENLTPNTVVIFDEIEAVASHRGAVETSAGKEFNSTVNTLLTLMDRNRSGVIVATTNRPDIIDPAVLRRFDEHVEFPAPSAEQLRSLADRLSDGFDIPRVPWDVIGDCQNYDAVTKVIEREARRIVMREILAAEAAAETESEPEEQSDGGEKEEDRAN